MKMVSSADRAREESPATPLLGIVSPPADYRNEIGDCTVPAAASDLVARLMFMQRTHKTYAGTSTVCTGVASRLPGTVVHEMTRRDVLDHHAFDPDAVNHDAFNHDAFNQDIVRIGHPAGVIETETRVERSGDVFIVRRATLGRTARRILEGYVFVPDAQCS
jgi:2-methylaconitate cis-trans-isomerase PrpF